MKKPSWLRDITINELLYNSLDAIRNSYNDCESLLLTERLTNTIAVILEKYNDESLFGCSQDAHHLNAIQTTLGQTVIIDFEDVGWQWRIYDLATAIWGTFGRGGPLKFGKSLFQGTPLYAFKPGGGRPNTFLNFCPSFMVARLTC